MTINEALSELLLSHSQAELANKLGISPTTLSDWLDANKECSDLTGKQLSMLEQLTGIDQTELNSNYTFISIEDKEDPNLEILTRRADLFAKVLHQETIFQEPVVKGEPENILDGTDSALQRLKHKAIVHIMGVSDAGKSSFYNFILGKKVLLEKLQPATAVGIILKHTSDKPAFMGAHDSLIVKNQAGIQSVHAFNQWVRSQANAQTLFSQGYIELAQFSQKQELINKKKGVTLEQTKEIAFIVHYLDSTILKVLDLVDTPGLSTDEKDEAIAVGLHADTDINIFMDTVVGFLNKSESIALFNQKFRKLTNLDYHLYIASHADTTKEELDHKEFFDTVIHRLEQNTGIKNLKPEDFYFFSTRKSDKYKAYQDQVVKALLGKVKRLYSQRIETLRDTKNEGITRYIELLDSLKEQIEQIAKIQAEIDRLRENRMDVFASFEMEVEKLNQITRELKQESKADLQPRLNDINASFIESTIRNHDWKKKDVQNYLGTALNNEIEARVQAVMEPKMEEFNRRVATFFEDLSAIKVGNVSFKDMNLIEFDFKGILAGMIASLGTMAVLGFWTATIASNLGAWIVVAKLGSLLGLSSLLGGAAAWTTLVAATGGPLVWGIGFALAIGGLVGGLINFFTGSSWQEKMAKKVMDKLREKNFPYTILDKIDESWDSTIEMNQKYLHELKAGYDAEIRKQEALCHHYKDDKARVEADLDTIRAAKKKSSELKDQLDY